MPSFLPSIPLPPSHPLPPFLPPLPAPGPSTLRPAPPLLHLLSFLFPLFSPRRFDDLTTSLRHSWPGLWVRWRGRDLGWPDRRAGYEGRSGGAGAGVGMGKREGRGGDGIGGVVIDWM